jgi:hypothetical protein
MKKGIILLMIGALLLSEIACIEPNKNAEIEVKDLRHYIDSVEQNRHNYYQDETYWISVEKHYLTEQKNIEIKAADLTTQARADYEKLKVDYAALKVKYTEERTKINARIGLRNSLYGDIKINDDISFMFMTAKNVLSIYQTFVTTVDNNKEEYSREEWDEIQTLYDTMNARKDEIEKEITAKDKKKITGQKIKFIAIKALNRPVSKAKNSYKTGKAKTTQ